MFCACSAFPSFVVARNKKSEQRACTVKIHQNMVHDSQGDAPTPDMKAAPGEHAVPRLALRTANLPDRKLAGCVLFCCVVLGDLASCLFLG